MFSLSRVVGGSLVGSEGACSVLSAVRLLFAQSFFCSFLSPSFGFLCVFTSHYIRVGCGCFTCRFFLSLSWLPFFFSFLSFFSCASLCVHACVLGGARVYRTGVYSYRR